MKILLKVNVLSEHSSGPNCAIVDLSDDAVAYLRHCYKAFEAAKQLESSVSFVEFHGSFTHYYDRLDLLLLLGTSEAAVFEDAYPAFVVLPEPFAWPEDLAEEDGFADEASVESEYLVCGSGGQLWWKAAVRHSDVALETHYLDIKMFDLPEAQPHAIKPRKKATRRAAAT